VNRTLFIAKLSRHSEEQVFSSFSSHNFKEIRRTLEEFGPLEDFTLLKEHRTGKSRGCGFVKYAYREDAIKAFSVCTTIQISYYRASKAPTNG
jgi:RNA recognition motif-containing protein